MNSRGFNFSRAIRQWVIAAMLLSLGVPVALAQAPTASAGLKVEALFVGLSNNVMGAMYRPVDPAQRRDIAVLNMHEADDRTRHFTCAGLASRGFTMLCFNNRYSARAGVRGTFIWDNIALDMKEAMNYARKLPGIKHVAIIGHSGGGAIVSYYQSVAQNGVKVCNDSRKIVPCSNSLAGLPPADGVVMIDPVLGHPFQRVVSYDPSVVKEDQFGRITSDMVDRSLSMFNPENGFDPKGPKYSREFVRKFMQAQAERNERLVQLALSRRDAIKAGKGLYRDNEPFIIGRQDAQIYSFDHNVWSNTRQARTLLTPQGPQTMVVKSVRPFGRIENQEQEANIYGGPKNGATKTDVMAYLSGLAIRIDPKQFQLTETGIVGVDWASANNSTPYHLSHVRGPLLMMAATGHYFVSTTEMMYDMAASTDKSLAFVYGATHGFTPCQNCSVPAKEFGDTMKITLDYIAQWLNGRFATK